MICFLSLLLLAQSASPLPDVHSVAALLHSNNFSEALKQIGVLMHQSPENPQLWTLQGIAHNGMDEPQAALADYQHALQIAPHYLPALKAEAQIQYKQGDSHAISTLRHILEIQPEDPVSHAMLGALAYQQHDCKAAVENYSASFQLLANQSTALTQYGECLLQQNQPARAVEALRQAALSDPGAWQTTYNLALAEASSEHPEEALHELEHLLTPDQHDPAVLDLASTLYESLGNTPKAVAVLRQAIVSNPKDTKLYVHFADLSFVHKSFPVGIDMLNAGLTQLPDSAELYVSRGVLLVQLGKYDAAEADFAKAERLNPNQNFSSVAQSLAKLQENKLDQALTTTETKIRRDPKNAFLYYLKAETLRQKGVTPPSAEFNQAVDAARTAVRLKPDYPIAEDLLGSFYLKEDKVDLAREQFEKALRHDPQNESALYHMITVSRKEGRTGDIAQFAKRLAEAKAFQKKREDLAGQFVMVEPHQP